MLGLVAGLSQPPSERLYVIKVETGSGQIYEAGVGSTCDEAMINARFPAAWVAINCERVR